MGYKEMWEQTEAANMELIEKIKEARKRIAAYEGEPSNGIIRRFSVNLIKRNYLYPIKNRKDVEEITRQIINDYHMAVRDTSSDATLSEGDV